MSVSRFNTLFKLSGLSTWLHCHDTPVGVSVSIPSSNCRGFPPVEFRNHRADGGEVSIPSSNFRVFPLSSLGFTEELQKCRFNPLFELSGLSTKHLNAICDKKDRVSIPSSNFRVFPPGGYPGRSRSGPDVSIPSSNFRVFPPDHREQALANVKAFQYPLRTFGSFHSGSTSPVEMSDTFQYPLRTFGSFHIPSFALCKASHHEFQYPLRTVGSFHSASSRFVGESRMCFNTLFELSGLSTGRGRVFGSLIRGFQYPLRTVGSFHKSQYDLGNNYCGCFNTLFELSGLSTSLDSHSKSKLTLNRCKAFI